MSVLESVRKVDYDLYVRVCENPRRNWIKTAKLVSHTGDGYCYVLFGLCAVYLAPQTGLAFFSNALLAFLIELPLYVSLKRLFKRERPFCRAGQEFAHITPSDRFSLPSGHSAAAFLMASLIAVYFPILAIFAYTYAAFIATSRVVLGVHYPMDTVAGMLLGLCCAELAMSIFRYLPPVTFF